MVVLGQLCRPAGRKPVIRLRQDAVTYSQKSQKPCPREKPLARTLPPVPQTDTGGLVEHTEVDGRPSVKELGKLAP